MSRVAAMCMECQKLSGPFHKPVRDSPVLPSNVSHIDPISGQDVTTLVSIAVAASQRIDIDDLPDVPVTCKLVKDVGRGFKELEEEQAEGGSLSQLPKTVLDKKTVAGHALTANKFMHFATSRIADSIAYADRVHKSLEELKQQHGVKGYPSQGGIYSGSTLLKAIVNARDQTVRVSLTKAVSKDLKGTNKNKDYAFIVYMLNSARAAMLMNVCLHYYRPTSDPRVAMLCAARAADVVNEDIVQKEPTPVGCECNQQISAHTVNFCGSCMHETVCGKLHTDAESGSLLCTRCKALADRGEQRLYKTALSMMKAKTCKNHINKCKKLGIDDHLDSERKRLKDMSSYLGGYIGDTDSTEWVDYYTVQDTEVSTESEVIVTSPRTGRTIRKDPREMSIDAVEPYSKNHDGIIRVHAKNNVVLTSAALNYVKHCHLPEFPAELATFHRKENVSAKDRLEFLQICNRLHRIRSEVPYKQKDRTTKIHPDRLHNDPTRMEMWSTCRRARSVGHTLVVLFLFDRRSWWLGPSHDRSPCERSDSRQVW